MVHSSSMLSLFATTYRSSLMTRWAVGDCCVRGSLQTSHQNPKPEAIE